MSCSRGLQSHIKGDYIQQYLIPYPNKAYITDLNTGEVVATLQAAMLEGW